MFIVDYLLVNVCGTCVWTVYFGSAVIDCVNVGRVMYCDGWPVVVTITYCEIGTAGSYYVNCAGVGSTYVMLDR